MTRHLRATDESPDDNPSPEDDVAVVHRVLEAPAGGRVQRDFADTITETGVGRLLTMELGGKLFPQLRAMGFAVASPPKSWPQNRDRLIHEAVYGETRAFLDGKLRRWDPAKGATLVNYYVRGCLMRFTNLYRQYLREEGVDGDETLMSDEDLSRLIDGTARWEAGMSQRSPESIAVDSAMLRHLVPDETDPTNKAILFERAALDRQWKDIAATHSLSVEAAESRYRRLQRTDGDEEK